jgi:hypothetical protein
LNFIITICACDAMNGIITCPVILCSKNNYSN